MPRDFVADILDCLGAACRFLAMVGVALLVGLFLLFALKQVI